MTLSTRVSTKNFYAARAIENSTRAEMVLTLHDHGSPWITAAITNGGSVAFDGTYTDIYGWIFVAGSVRHPEGATRYWAAYPPHESDGGTWRIDDYRQVPTGVSAWLGSPRGEPGPINGDKPAAGRQWVRAGKAKTRGS